MILVPTFGNPTAFRNPFIITCWDTLREHTWAVFTHFLAGTFAQMRAACIEEFVGGAVVFAFLLCSLLQTEGQSSDVIDGWILPSRCVPALCLLLMWPWFGLQLTLRLCWARTVLREGHIEWRPCCMKAMLSEGHVEWRPYWVKAMLSEGHAEWRPCWVKAMLSEGHIEWRLCWVKAVLSEGHAEWRPYWVKAMLSEGRIEWRPCWAETPGCCSREELSGALAATPGLTWRSIAVAAPPSVGCAALISKALRWVGNV